MIVPFFRVYPLVISKLNDFYLFDKITALTVDKGHLDFVWILLIIELAFTMNPSGTRKYSKQQLFEILTKGEGIV